MDSAYIMITLHIKGRGESLELEMPNNISIGKLTETIINSFKLEKRKYKWKIKSSDKFINSDETLSEAGVLDGTELELL